MLRGYAKQDVVWGLWQDFMGRTGALMSGFACAARRWLLCEAVPDGWGDHRGGCQGGHCECMHAEPCCAMCAHACACVWSCDQVVKEVSVWAWSLGVPCMYMCAYMWGWLVGFLMDCTEKTYMYALTPGMAHSALKCNKTNCACLPACLPARNYKYVCMLLLMCASD